MSSETKVTNEAANSDGKTVHRGHCYCGGVEFEVTHSPDMKSGAVYCHCESCRRAHAAPMYQVVYVEPTEIQFTKGEELITKFKRDADGAVERWFCSQCGSRVANHNLKSSMGWDGYIGFFPALLSDKDQHNLPSAFRAKMHALYSEHVIEAPDDGLPREP